MVVRALYRLLIDEMEKISQPAARILEEAEIDALIYLSFLSKQSIREILQKKEMRIATTISNQMRRHGQMRRG